MPEQSDVLTSLREKLVEHAEIDRVVGRCIASIDETVARSREIISETRELLAEADKQLGIR